MNFLSKIDDSVFVEDDRDDKLPSIIKEMLRWKDIIGNDYIRYKQSKIRSSLV